MQVCLGEATAAKIMAWVKNNYTGKLRLKVSIELHVSKGGASCLWAEHVACVAVRLTSPMTVRLCAVECHMPSGEERA